MTRLCPFAPPLCPYFPYDVNPAPTGDASHDLSGWALSPTDHPRSNRHDFFKDICELATQSEYWRTMHAQTDTQTHGGVQHGRFAQRQIQTGADTAERTDITSLTSTRLYYSNVLTKCLHSMRTYTHTRTHTHTHTHVHTRTHVSSAGQKLFSDLSHKSVPGVS